MRGRQHLAHRQARNVAQGVLEELQHSQFEGFRGIRRLVDAGLVLVDEPRVRPASHRPGRRLVAGTGDEAMTTSPAPTGRLAEASASLVEAALRAQPATAAPAQVEPVVLFEPATPVYVVDDGDSGDASPDWYDDEAEEDDDAEAGIVHFPIHDEDTRLPVAAGGQAPQYVESLRGQLARQQLAAAFAVDDEVEPEQAPARPVPAASNEAINRGLLLKFLSSVRS